MIKNIIFDIGNVLVAYRPEEYLDRFGFDENVRKAVLHGIFHNKNWEELDRGTIDEAEAIRRFCEEAPEVEAEIRKVMENWKELLIPLPETIEILRELKEKEYKVFALSNYHKAAFAKILAENDFFSLLDGRVISYEIHLVKPEKEIYEYILNKYQLKPEESLFVDDMQRNLDGASLCGIHTHLFDTPLRFKEYLKEHKLL
jgi:FMN phosphatase YigB (HAD superfamily)